jgi:hypothetical protein
MKITELKLIREPSEEYKVTQYYLVLDDVKQCITWWSQHYDDLKVGDDVEMIEDNGEMNWKVNDTMRVVSKVKLKPMKSKKVKAKPHSNVKLKYDVELLRMVLTHCHHMDKNTDYEIFRMYRLLQNIENPKLYEKIKELDIQGEEIR